MLRVLLSILLLLIGSNTLLGQWEPYDLPTKLNTFNSYRDIFTLQDTIWIIGDYGDLHKSIDGGTTWSLIDFGGRFKARKIHFVDGQRGFIVGRDGFAIKTTDGGMTWTTIFEEDAILGNNDLTDIYFIGERGWLVGHSGLFYKTEDGGEHWMQQNLPVVFANFFNLTSIHFPSESVGYLVGHEAGFYKTTDGGQTWQYQKYFFNGFNQKIYLQHIFFKNELEGWGTNGGNSYRTINGGETWTGVNSVLFVPLFYFYSDKLGWALHINGRISRTINGGNNWTEEKAYTTGHTLTAITIDERGNGWALGEANQIYQKIKQAEIAVSNGTTFISNQDTFPDFIDSTDFGTPQETFNRTFNIHNTFTDTLILRGESAVKIVGSTDFKIIQQPTSKVLPDDTTQFVIEYTPSGEGAAARVIIENNSLRDSTFDFNIQGNCATCIIEGYNAVCDSTQNLVYTAPAGMHNYQWNIEYSGAEIIGPANQQSVTVNVTNTFVALELEFEEPNGCLRKCTKNITVGLSIDEDCTTSMAGPRSLCTQSDSIRYTTPQTFIVGNGITSGPFYALAETYKWEIIAGDATINGTDSLYEVFVDAGNEDFTLQLTIANFPDCSVTCVQEIEVQGVEDYGICGNPTICEDAETAIYTAAANMESYEWIVSNEDSVIQSSRNSYVKVTQLDKDFTVALEATTNIGCQITDELMVQTGQSCLYEPNDTIYVNANITSGNQDGSSWANAFSNLQAALDLAVSTDEIWIAQGIYLPSKNKFGVLNPKDSVAVTFFIDKEIQLFGGFVGNEQTILERNWETNQTILSGDLKQDDVLFDNILDSRYPAINTADNANSVIHLQEGGKYARLDGLIIQSGNATIYQGYEVYNEKNTGAGIFIQGESCETIGRITIENCLLRYHKADWGGGIAVIAAGRSIIQPMLKSCEFTHNSGGGFGIYTTVPTIIEPTLTDCRFTQNRGNSGGAVYLKTLAGENRITFERCVFDKNRSNWGGAVYSYLNNLKTISSPSFYDCQFTNNGNSAGFGGAIYLHHEINIIPQERPNPTSVPYFERALFRNNQAGIGGAVYAKASYRKIQPNFTNSAFVKNKSENEGSAVYTESSNSSLFPSFHNCTVAYNSGKRDGAIFHEGNGHYIFYNSIIWKNTPQNLQNQELNFLVNTLIEEKECPPKVACGFGVLLGEDPLFVDTISDFRLSNLSPAIDRGGQVFLSAWSSTFKDEHLDLNGNDRFVATLNPDTAIIDLGAYEFQDAPILQVNVDTQLARTATADILYDTFYTDEQYTYEFVAKNVGSLPLNFTNNPAPALTNTTDFNLVQSLSKNSLALLETDTFQIQFEAKTVGDFETAISIPYNSHSGEDYQTSLQIKVMPRPDTPQLKITLLDFPEITLRDTILQDSLCATYGHEYAFEVENTGTGFAAYNNEKVKLDQVNYIGFSLKQQLKLDSLASGQKDTFIVQFNPWRADTRYYVGIDIASNTMDSPNSFGIQNYAYRCSDTTTAAVTLDSSSVSLSEVTLVDNICWGETKSYDFQLKNTGTDFLRLNVDSRVNNTNPAFLLKEYPATLIEPNEIANFQIIFVGDTVGTYESVLTIPYNSENGQPYQFNLKVVVHPNDTPSEQEFCENESTGNGNRIIAAAKDGSVGLGDTICIPISLGDVENINFIDATLLWDTTYFKYAGFRGNEKANINEQNNVFIEDNQFRMAWSGRQTGSVNLSQSDTLFEVCFRAIQLGTTELIFDELIFLQSTHTQNNRTLLKSGTYQIVENLTTICQENFVLDNSSNMEYQQYQAEKTITASTLMTSEEIVSFQAGTTITLMSGFAVPMGSNFTAEIMDINCETDAIFRDTNTSDLEVPTTEKITSIQINHLPLISDLWIAPNPFHQSTILKYELNADTEVNLSIYKVDGQLMEEIVQTSHQTKGTYEYVFNPNTIETSMFFAILTTPEGIISKKLLFIR